ncbi:ABC transporter permease [Humitalea sp. 24SJ18S-53]|uniref:ABC transporter permease n=1 Tax=Humitalea sp. 24SJ18S-53 TaxID=3422307 RepID=UPI003D6713FC
MFRFVSVFIARRLLVSIPVLLGILFITFMLVRIGQQDPAAMIAGPIADPIILAQVRQDLGLDQPLWMQFGHYLLRLAHGDLGRSWQDGTPILHHLVSLMPITLELVIPALVLSLLIGVPIGLHAALYPNRIFDQLSRGIALLGFSVPTYWLGLMAIFVFFYLLGWAPAPMGLISMELMAPPVATGFPTLDAMLAGDWDAARSSIGHLVLPVSCLMLAAGGPVIKQTRAIAIELLGSDHVLYARAAGFSNGRIQRIVARGALVPLITFAGVELVSLFATGSLIEYVFARGGLGHWGLNAIMQSDFAAVQGYVLALAVCSVVAFLLVDLAGLLLEPRN